MALGYLISPVIQIEDINGKPLVGGFVRVYVHGTTIPYITQKNFDGDLNPAEVVLDNKGMCVLLAEAGNLYDVYCEDRNRVEQWSRVNVGVCGGGGGAGSSSYISTIYSSDNSLTIIRTGSTVDIKINRDGDASAMAVFSDPLTADGLFEFNHEPINYSGNDIGLLDGEIICRRRWYHFDATAVLDWQGSSVNSDARINLIGPDVNEYVDFDLSYAHKHSFDVSGVFEINSDGTAVPFQITGLPQGMSAQLVNVSIHALTVGAGGSGGGTGEFIHDNTLVGDSTLASPAGVNTELIQEKLEAGEGITIEGNTISVTGGQGHTYTGIDPIHINDEDEISLQSGTGLTTDEQGNLIIDNSVVQEKLVAGTGIDITNNVISATGGGGGGGIEEVEHDSTLTGDGTNDDPLSVDTSVIQEKLVAGSGISITGNVITATGGGAPQVQADWAQTDSSAVDYIKNKPTIPSGDQLVPPATSADEDKVLTVDSNGDPTWAPAQGGGGGLDAVSHGNTLTGDGTSSNPLDVNLSSVQEKLVAGTNITITGNVISATGGGSQQVQSDWTETDTTDPSYIQNKPAMNNLVAGTGIALSMSGSNVVISATAAQPQVQADWAQTDSTAVDYIQNKPANLVQDADYVHTDNNFTDTLKDKLDGVASGAEVNVQSDWNETNSSSDAYILNKPTIPSGNQLVPSATSSDATKVLTVDSNGVPGWASSGSTGLFIAQYGISTYAEITAAINANRIVYCRVSPSSSTSTLASLAYIGSGYYQFQYYKKLTTHSYSNQGDEVYVYKIASDNTWSVSGGNAYTTIRPGANMTKTYSNGIMTLDVTLPTVDQTYDGTSTNAQSGTAIEGKLANYTPTASLATVANTGAYSDLSGTPTVDQTYNSASANAQSGTAIAGALAGKEDAFTVGSGLEMDTSGSTPVLQVSFTQQLLDEFKRALGVDETVLWEGTAVMSNNPSLTLSESAMNFKFVDIYSLPHGTNDIAIVTRIYTDTLAGDTDAQGSFTITGHAGGGGFRINNAFLRIVNYTTMTFTEQKQTSFVGTAVTTASATNSIIKIVGIGRKII